MTTRDALLDAAATLVEARGLDALSVRLLATEVGESRQAVYTHFGGKAGLLDALHQRSSAALAADVMAVDARPGSIDHLVAVSRAYVEAFRRRPRTSALVFADAVPGFTPSDEARRAARRSFGCVVDAVRDHLGEPAGDAGPSPEALGLARALWSATHGAVSLELAGHASDRDTDALVSDLVRSIVAGWSATNG